MDYDTITFAAEEGVVLITLNRPEVMNALNSQMRGEIADAIKLAPEYGRVLVITGAGPAFCSGQDLGDGVNPAEADLERTLVDEYFPLLREFQKLEIPTICAVNGAAAGAGANLALTADVVIATESAYFVQAFTRIGLIPDAGGTWLLPRKIGIARSMGLALFADKVMANDAEKIGMIWESVADDQFTPHWQARAATLAAGPTEAYKQIKAAIRASFDHSYEKQLSLEAKLQGQVGKTRDFREGVLAFLEKRAPDFEGR